MDFKVVVAIGVLAFTGCATTPANPLQASAVPAERLLAFQTVGPGPGPTAQIVVTRDKGFLGGGCYYSLYINSVLAARMDAAETASFVVPVGEVLLKSGRDRDGRGLCAVNKEEWTQRETILKAGERKYFRMSLDQNGKTDIQRADPVM